MKNFIKKNASYLIAACIIVGGVGFFTGLDFEQSQVKAKADASTPLMVAGGALFLGGCAWLYFNTWGKTRKNG